MIPDLPGHYTQGSPLLEALRCACYAPGDDTTCREVRGTGMSEDESFKITDRRGRAQDAARGGPDAGVSEESGSSPARSPRAEPADEPPEPPASAKRAPAGPDLQGLFVMFASSVLINLGVAEDPVSGDRHMDLDQAQDGIDMLLLLRDKTIGNRTEQESRFLEEVLYDLQIRFVRAAPGRQPR